MTSVSRKKRQIILSSTHQWMRSKRTALAACCALILAASTGGIHGQEQPPRRSTAAPAGRQQYPSPLDRLRARSAEERWESLSGTAHVDELGHSPSRPPAAKQQSGRLKVTPAPQSDQLLPAGHDRVFSEESAEELPMPRSLPQTEAIDASPKRSAGIATPDNAGIYQEIEDEFPRIRVEAAEAPPVEALPIIAPAAIEPPVINSTESTYTEPAHIAQTPSFDDSPNDFGDISSDFGDRPQRQSLGELVSTPKDLKPLSNIEPYYDYEPDPELQKTDPYRNVFPRPDGTTTTEQGRQFPEIVDLGNDLYQKRNLAQVDFYWKASDYWHYPLYFQDVQFERYGHTYNPVIQPFVSFGRFGTQFFGLPYQMALQPMWKKEYSLGWYRPGERAPYLHYQIPWNTDAAVRTAGFYTGMIFAFP